MSSRTIIASICFSIPLNTFALCFESPRPCAWYAVHHGQPTFIGTAISEQTLPDVIDAGGQDIHVTVQKVIFSVEEPFDGAPNKTESVYGSGTTNDFHFKVGERYLVYGWREKDGKIRTAKCTRTDLVNEAAEDIQFLRALTNQSGGEIFGSVRVAGEGNLAATVTGTIRELGAGGKRRVRVSDSGSYDLKGLAPGNYRETFIPDDTDTEYVNLKINIPVSGSCAESGVRLGDVTVSGRVVDDAGKLVPRTDVYLFYAFDGHYHPDVFLKTRTNSVGTFGFSRVDPAKFILAAQPAHSPMTFFPNTREPSIADVIELRESTPISNLVVRISRSRKNN